MAVLVNTVKRYKYGFLIIGSLKTVSVPCLWYTESEAKSVAACSPHLHAAAGKPFEIITVEDRACDVGDNNV